jgi:hypothetical protein
MSQNRCSGVLGLRPPGAVWRRNDSRVRNTVIMGSGGLSIGSTCSARRARTHMRRHVHDGHGPDCARVPGAR